MSRQLQARPPLDWPFSESWSATRRYKSRKLIEETRRQPAGFSATLKERWASIPQAPQTERTETMGRLLTAIPSSAPVVVEVPEDVAKELDELYAYMVEHPEFMAQATFTKDDDTTPDPDAAVTFLKQAKAWGEAHKDENGNPAPLECRKSPSRTLPDHIIRFNIRVPLTPEEVAANKAKNAKAAEAREARKAQGTKAGRK